MNMQSLLNLPMRSIVLPAFISHGVVSALKADAISFVESPESDHVYDQSCKDILERTTSVSWRILNDHLDLHCRSPQSLFIHSPQEAVQLRNTLKDSIADKNLNGVACAVRVAANQLNRICSEGVSNGQVAALTALENSFINQPLFESASGDKVDPPLAYSLQQLIEQDSPVTSPTLWLLAAGADPSQTLSKDQTYLKLSQEADKKLGNFHSLQGLVYGFSSGFRSGGGMEKLENPEEILDSMRKRIAQLSNDENMLMYIMLQAARTRILYSGRSEDMRESSRYLFNTVVPNRCLAYKDERLNNPNSGSVNLGARLLSAVQLDDNQESIQEVSCVLASLERNRDQQSGQIVNSPQLNFQDGTTSDTPLHAAVRLLRDGNTPNKRSRGTILTAMLLAAGASPTLRNAENLIPIEILYGVPPKNGALPAADDEEEKDSQSDKEDKNESKPDGESEKEVKKSDSEDKSQSLKEKDAKDETKKPGDAPVKDGKQEKAAEGGANFLETSSSSPSVSRHEPIVLSFISTVMNALAAGSTTSDNILAPSSASFFEDTNVEAPSISTSTSFSEWFLNTKTSIPHSFLEDVNGEKEDKDKAKQEKKDGKDKAKQEKKDGKAKAKQEKKDGKAKAKQEKKDGKAKAKQEKKDGKDKAKQEKKDGKAKAKQEKKDGKAKAKHETGTSAEHDEHDEKEDKDSEPAAENLPVKRSACKPRKPDQGESGTQKEETSAEHDEHDEHDSTKKVEEHNAALEESPGTSDPKDKTDTSKSDKPNAFLELKSETDTANTAEAKIESGTKTESKVNSESGVEATVESQSKTVTDDSAIMSVETKTAIESGSSSSSGEGGEGDFDEDDGGNCDDEEEMPLVGAILAAYGGEYIAESTELRGVASLSLVSSMSKNDFGKILSEKIIDLIDHDTTLERVLLIQALPQIEKIRM